MVERDGAGGRRGAAQDDVREPMGESRGRDGIGGLRCIASADVPQKQDKSGQGLSRPRGGQHVV